MIPAHYEDGQVKLYHGDCRDVLAAMPDQSVHAVVTDPPYELGYAGKKWDSSGIAFDGEVWRQCLRVVKPGGWLLSFGGTRTWHRLAVAVEDAGWMLRDQISWIYRTGMPYATNVAKVVEAQERGYTAASNGVRRAEAEDGGTMKFGESAAKWEGWHTSLKPAFEPIILAQKPHDRTIANTAATYGTGGLNIEALRIASSDNLTVRAATPGTVASPRTLNGCATLDELRALVATGDPEVRTPGGKRAVLTLERIEALAAKTRVKGHADGKRWPPNVLHDGTTGLPEKFFPLIEAKKASRAERPRVGNFMHHTVKPLELMRWLVTLVTQPEGTVILDPFAGSGATLEAAIQLGVQSIGIELEEAHLPLIMQRVDRSRGEDV